MSGAQDLIVEEHASFKGNSEVGAKVSSGVKFTLVASNKHFFIVFLADHNGTHFTFAKLVSPSNFDLFDVIGLCVCFAFIIKDLVSDEATDDSGNSKSDPKTQS